MRLFKKYSLPLTFLVIMLNPKSPIPYLKTLKKKKTYLSSHYCDAGFDKRPPLTCLLFIQCVIASCINQGCLAHDRYPAWNHFRDKSNFLTHLNKIWRIGGRACTGMAGSRRVFLHPAYFIELAAFLPKTSFLGCGSTAFLARISRFSQREVEPYLLSSSLLKKKKKIRKNWASLGAAHHHGLLPHSPLPGDGAPRSVLWKQGHMPLWLVPPHTASLAEWRKERFPSKVSGFGNCHSPLSLLHGCPYVTFVSQLRYSESLPARTEARSLFLCLSCVSFYFTYCWEGSECLFAFVPRAERRKRSWWAPGFPGQQGQHGGDGLPGQRGDPGPPVCIILLWLLNFIFLYGHETSVSPFSI